MLIAKNDLRSCTKNNQYSYSSVTPKRNESNENPSAGIIDSQTVNGTTESARESGLEGGKLIKSRERHILLDTAGYLIVALVYAANIHEGQPLAKS